VTLPRAAAIRVFACFAFGYFLSYALRSVNAVIAPSLMSDLQLNTAQLGQLTSAYLISFALLQFPLGSWLDRYGPRRTEAALLLFAACGCGLFSVATSYGRLWVGRALIGVGVSGCLMAAFKGFRDWYAPELQSRLAAWMLVAGTSGVLVTTVPVQRMVGMVGWRPVFAMAALLLTLSSIAIFLGLPKDRDVQNVASKTFSQHNPSDAPIYTLKDIFRFPYFWRMAMLGVVFNGGFIAIQSLWLGPWFTTVFGFSPARAADLLFVFNLVLMLAYLGLGTIMPKLESRGVSVPQLAIMTNALGISAMVLINFKTESQWWWLWLFVAIATTANTLIQTHTSMRYPKALAGRTNAAFNFCIFVGAWALQWGFGSLVELFKSQGLVTAAAFQKGLWVYIAIASCTWLVFFFWRPAEPKF
jgi:nitrate/nitrite transporter NarK